MRIANIDSSLIATIDYDPAAGTLDVEFRSGRTYRYFMVPAATVERLLNSQSIGSFFNREIRNRYSNREIA